MTATTPAGARPRTQRGGSFGRRDELEIASRPARGAVVGTYTTARAPSTRQSRKRTRRRAGEPRPYTTVNLVSEGSIEARIAGLVRTKQALFAGLFDGTSDELRFDTAASFLTSVERIVDRSAPEVSTAGMMDPDETESDAP